MLEQSETKKIKESIESFFEKMTFPASEIKISISKDEADEKSSLEENRDAVDADIKFEEPQILIGQQGQTLFEIQRLLRLILNKKLQKVFYLNLDINDYKRKKVDYLKNFAKELADQAVIEKQVKEFLPMPAFERRIIHAELSKRNDIITESIGEGSDRRVAIRPK